MSINKKDLTGHITMDELLTSSGKYPARAKEADSSVKAAATILLAKVNAMMAEAGFSYLTVSSGYRTALSNSRVANAAKRSLHMTGKAIDVVDTDGEIKSVILRRPELLAKHGLWMEDPQYTKTWAHFDIGDRKDRPIRIFRP